MFSFLNSICKFDLFFYGFLLVFILRASINHQELELQFKRAWHQSSAGTVVPVVIVIVNTSEQYCVGEERGGSFPVKLYGSKDPFNEPRREDRSFLSTVW